MIKFTAATGEGSSLIGLGLTEENLRRLGAGQPIVVKLAELLPGVQIEVLIFAGRDEYDLTERLASFIGPDTTVRKDGA